MIEILRDTSVRQRQAPALEMPLPIVGHAELRFAEVRGRLGVTGEVGEALVLYVMTPAGPLRMSGVWGDEHDLAIWRLEAIDRAVLPWLAGAMGDIAAFVWWAVDDPATPPLRELVWAYAQHIGSREGRISAENAELHQLMVELSQCISPATAETPWPPFEELPTGGWYEPRFGLPAWVLAPWRWLRAGAPPKWPAQPATGLADMAAAVQWLAKGRALRYAWLRRAHPRRDFRLYAEYVAVLRALARLAASVPVTPSGGLTVVRRASSAAVGGGEPFGGGWRDEPDMPRAALAYGEFLVRRLTGLELDDHGWKLSWLLADEVFCAVLDHADSTKALRGALVRIVTVRTRYAEMFAAGAHPAAAKLLEAHAETLHAIADS